MHYYSVNSQGNKTILSRPTEWVPRKVERIDLVEHVAGQIKACIIENKLPPKSSLPGEIELADQFGVSRTVIRESLRVLSAQGLVELSHGRRATVTAPNHAASAEALWTLFRRSNATPIDLMELREAIEGEVTTLATIRATEEDIKALEETCRALKAATNFEERVKADVAFHIRLAEATHNPCFVRVMQTLHSLFLDSVRRTQESCGCNVHDPILEAVVSRDPARAREAMMQHLRYTKALLSGNTIAQGEPGQCLQPQQPISGTVSSGNKLFEPVT